MDLLAGYGTGSDDGGSDAEQAASAPTAAAKRAPASASLGSSLAHLPPPKQPTGTGPGRSGLFASLLQPSGDDDGPGSSFDAFGLAPAPTAKPKAVAKPARQPAARKVVQLRTLKPLAPGDDGEEEQPKKKLKPSQKGLSFLDSLPKPVHDAGPPAGTALGAGSASARALGGGLASEQLLPSSFFDGGASDAGGAAELAAGPSAQYASNDAYRVSAPEVTAAASYNAEVGPARPSIGSYEDYGGGYGGRHGAGAAEYGATNGAAPPAPPPQRQQQHHYGAGPGYGPAARLAGDDMLAAAMAAESGRGSGGGAADPFAGMDIKFKEVNQKSLTYVDPARAAAKQGLRQALGKEHELQLRREADAVEPEKLAKRKHQISSLYHAAKLKELEMLSDHGGTLKTKRETQAKYGW